MSFDSRFPIGALGDDKTGHRPRSETINNNKTLKELNKTAQGKTLGHRNKHHQPQV